MRVSTVIQRICAVGVGLLLVAGCGGDKGNGIDKLGAQQALTKAKADLATVKTVHVHGDFTESGQKYSIDLHLKRGAGYGTLTLGGGRLDIVRIGDTA